jgi:hypothetical protein
MNLEMFDAVEVHRCVRCMDAGLNEYVEIDDGEDAPVSHEAVGDPFWVVYLHHVPDRGEGRGLECVADCATLEKAEMVSQAMEAIMATPSMPAEVACLLEAFEGMAASVRDRGAVPRKVADALVARSRVLRRRMGSAAWAGS